MDYWFAAIGAARIVAWVLSKSLTPGSVQGLEAATENSGRREHLRPVNALPDRQGPTKPGCVHSALYHVAGSVDMAGTLYYKVEMMKRSVATLELMLVFPAALFMASLFVRQMQPPQYQPAHAAQIIVEWFSQRPHLGLAVLLIALPLAALVIGCATVLRNWRTDAIFREAALEMVALIRAHFAMLLVTGATLMAGCILAVVAVHMMTD